MGKKEPSSQVDTAVFSQLREENAALKQEVEQLRGQLERMNELLLNAQRARFGQSSEKQEYVMPQQMGLFNEAETEQKHKASEPIEETRIVKEHKRKPKCTVEELSAGLPVKEGGRAGTARRPTVLQYLRTSAEADWEEISV